MDARREFAPVESRARWYVLFGGLALFTGCSFALQGLLWRSCREPALLGAGALLIIGALLVRSGLGGDVVYAVDEQGITSTTLRRRRTIAWSEITGYEIRHGTCGIAYLLRPRRGRALRIRTAGLNCAAELIDLLEERLQPLREEQLATLLAEGQTFPGLRGCAAGAAVVATFFFGLAYLMGLGCQAEVLNGNLREAFGLRQETTILVLEGVFVLVTVIGAALSSCRMLRVGPDAVCSQGRSRSRSIPFGQIRRIAVGALNTETSAWGWKVTDNETEIGLPAGSPSKWLLFEYLLRAAPQAELVLGCLSPTAEHLLNRIVDRSTPLDGERHRRPWTDGDERWPVRRSAAFAGLLVLGALAIACSPLALVVAGWQLAAGRALATHSVVTTGLVADVDQAGDSCVVYYTYAEGRAPRFGLVEVIGTGRAPKYHEALSVVCARVGPFHAAYVPAFEDLPSRQAPWGLGGGVLLALLGGLALWYGKRWAARAEEQPA